MCLYSSVEACKQKKHDEQKKMNKRKLRKKYKASPDSVFCDLKTARSTEEDEQKKMLEKKLRKTEKP